MELYRKRWYADTTTKQGGPDVEYKACEFFVSRVPLLPVESYFDVFGNGDDNEVREKLFSLFKSADLEEALAVASLDSHQALARVSSTDSTKAAGQLLSTLIKYYIRLTTRPTPYGLFSGVSIGTFGEKSDMVVSNTSKHTKRARVDTEWLYAVIKQIESTREIRRLLKVRFNDYVCEDGSRLEKPTTTFLQLNTATAELGTSIKYTRQVNRVEEAAHEPVVFSDLLSELSAENPGVPPDKIDSFLDQLFENEYLLSELRPPIVNTDALDHVIHALRRIAQNSQAKEYCEQLESIRTAIAKYNAAPIGNGIELFDEIIAKMKTVYAAKNYLQVDMKTAMDSNELPHSLKEELEEFVAAMVRITPEEQISDEYADYFDRFLEKYGTAAEIPVLELLDTDKGLGLPSYYHGAARRPTPKRQKAEKTLRLERLLKRKLMLSLKENTGILALTDSDIDYIAGGNAPNIAPKRSDYLPSFELFLIAHPGSTGTSKEAPYCFTLAPAMASNGIGKGIGRFRDMFSAEETSCFHKQAVKLQEAFSDYIIAEIAEIPERGRTSNVCTNYSDCDYQLMLSTNRCDGKQALSIRDLYISADPSSRRFHIRSRSLHKEVVVTATSMLNPTFGSSAVRFLKEISTKYRFNVIDTIANITRSDYEYIPRITYKRIVLKPATWLISRDALGISGDKEDSFIHGLQDFRKKWNVPRYVHLAEFDNRLLFDLDNPLHIHEIYHFVKKQNSRPLQFMEEVCNFDEYAARDQAGRHYATEVVVPFCLSGDLSEHEYKADTRSFFLTTSDTRLNAMSIAPRKQILLPGSGNWLYFKLYGYRKRKEELIAKLYELLEMQIRDSQIKKYFFIRYSDPEPHLRVRVQAEADQLSHVFAEMTRQLEKLRLDGLLSQVVIDTYQRETERYGGAQLIGKAEDYFFHDSRTVMKILHKQHTEKVSINFEYIGVSLIISTLHAFGLSMEMTAQFLNASNNQKSYRKEFQKDRKLLVRAANDLNDWEEIRQVIDYPNVYDELSALSDQAREYAEAVFQADRDGVLTNSVEGIARSIIHMFCNRLVGNNAWEQKVYALARHGTHDLNARLKHRA